MSLKYPIYKFQMPPWLFWMQVFCFIVLYSIWSLPQTIFIRNASLILGALISFYEIYQFRHLLLERKAIQVWILGSLFIWMVIHLFFISNNFSLQIVEYASIWKRTLIGFIFGLGFGVTLMNQKNNYKWCWPLIYLGLLMPTLIYILKFTLTNFGSNLHIIAPEYLKLHDSLSSLPFYVTKTSYVSFCLPVLAIALGKIQENIKNNHWINWGNFVYLISVQAVLFVFYSERIKNGIVYSLLLLGIFLFIILKDFHKSIMKNIILIIGILIPLTLFLNFHIKKEESWKTFIADSKIAVQIEKYDNWKNTPEYGFPNNEFGNPVSGTNYERIAWGLNGILLVLENPLGFGLIERSFGQITKNKWPNSNLTQSHSGWIDLTLGIGIPGLLVIMTALLTSVYRLSVLNRLLMTKGCKTWSVVSWWALVSLLLMWCTTELSQKVYFDELIFWISLAAGVLLGGAQNIVINPTIKEIVKL